MSAYDVHTWADGFGIWHARVSLPGEGYGPDALEREHSAIRRAAQRATRAEIVRRENPNTVLAARNLGALAPVRVELAEVKLDSFNVAWSVTYRERAS